MTNTADIQEGRIVGRLAYTRVSNILKKLIRRLLYYRSSTILNKGCARIDTLILKFTDCILFTLITFYYRAKRPNKADLNLTEFNLP